MFNYKRFTQNIKAGNCTKEFNALDTQESHKFKANFPIYYQY